jgi:cysteine synthase A
VDIFVACVGTGGTLTGVGRFLKEKNPQTRVIAVEPSASPLLSKGIAGKHGIQGIGANFVPAVLDKSVLDEVLTVSGDEAIEMAKTLYQLENAFVGISSGANVLGAIALAKREENKGKKIVTVFPDSGDRYASIF